MKLCTKCKQTKSLSEFGLRNIDKQIVRSWCKDCEKTAKRNWDKVRTHHLKEYVFNLLSTSKCVECKTTDILVLEFDHKNPKTKRFNIGKAISGKEFRVSLEELIAEIDKCEVMCRNCHQRKTHMENNSWRWSLSRQAVN